MTIKPNSKSIFAPESWEGQQDYPEAWVRGQVQKPPVQTTLDQGTYMRGNEDPPTTHPLGGVPKLITLEQYFMGRDNTYEDQCLPNIRAYARETVDKVNILMPMINRSCGWHITPLVRSGWRPQEVNAKTPGAALHSKHLTAQAIDLADSDGFLKHWSLGHLQLLEDVGLWMEAPECTPTWIHLQTVAPASGHRVFIA